MSLAQDGINSKIKNHKVEIKVSNRHPLILLANALPWNQLSELACADLKRTTNKGMWMVGRKLFVRTHLGIYILQARTKKTDREIISEIQDNAAYQVFCGSSVIPKWKFPHATKVEEFRSRLSPETKMKINDVVVGIAVDKNFGNPSELDIDSTVQEVNVSYPTDAGMLMKLAKKCSQVARKLKTEVQVNMKKIGNLARSYFFRSKKCSTEEASDLLKKYYNGVKEEILPVIAYAEKRVVEDSLRLKWNLKELLKTIAIYGRQYLKDVGYYVRTHKARKAKILSFHAKDVACISKGKVAKKHEFGRVFQIGRIGGNFLVALCSGVKLADKKALKPMLEKHRALFGKRSLKSVATDKGYYSSSNVKAAKRNGAEKVCIQKPGPISKGDSHNSTVQEELRCRRAGIEPLIAHAKKFGLGRSKMKTDKNTHGSGFTAIMGFNLSQLEKRLKNGSVNIAS